MQNFKNNFFIEQLRWLLLHLILLFNNFNFQFVNSPVGTRTKKNTFKRRPYQDVFKWFSWEILKDVLKRTAYVRPEKNVLCTSSKGHHMYVLRRTCFIRICERYKKHLSIFPNAYIYSLHRMSCIHLFFAQNVHQESWYLTSCFNQLQRYFVCHFEPSFDIIITIIITIMTLSMSEYHRMGWK